MRTVIALVVITIGMSTGAAAQPGSSPALLPYAGCNCKDIRDVKNRICEAEAAIKEYDRLDKLFEAQEKRELEPVFLNASLRDKINKGCAQEAINAATDRRAGTATAQTIATCEIVKVSAASACLKEGVLRHEGYHSTACYAREDGKWAKFLKEYWNFYGNLAGVMVDTKYAMSAREFVQEERAAYQTELRHYLVVFKSMKLDCKYPADFEVKNADGSTYDLSSHPCPSRPRLAKGAPDSKCELQ